MVTDTQYQRFKKKRERKVKLRESKQKFKDLFTPIRLLRLAIIVFLISLLSMTLGRELLIAGQGSLQSFIIVHFSGYLFFFLLPVEALIPYYYSLGYSSWLLFGLALITAIAAQLIDYGIGRLAPSHITKSLVGEERYAKIQKFVDRYGSGLIFFFNLFPLSSSVVAAVAGVLHFSLWRTVLYSSLGLLVKYAVILFVLGVWL